MVCLKVVNSCILTIRKPKKFPRKFSAQKLPSFYGHLQI